MSMPMAKRAKSGGGATLGGSELKATICSLALRLDVTSYRATKSDEEVRNTIQLIEEDAGQYKGLVTQLAHQQAQALTQIQMVVSKHTGQATDVQTANTTVGGYITTVESELADCKELVDCFINEDLKLEKRVAHLKEQVAAQIEQKEMHRKMLHETKEQCQKLKQELKQTTHTHRKEEASVQQATDTFENSKSKLEAANKHGNDLNTQLTYTRGRTKECEQRLRVLTQNVHDQETVNCKNKNDLDNETRSFNARTRDVQRVLSENQQKAQDIQAVRNNISHLQAQAEQLAKDSEQKEKQIAESKNAITGHNHIISQLQREEGECTVLIRHAVEAIAKLRKEKQNLQRRQQNRARLEKNKKTSSTAAATAASSSSSSSSSSQSSGVAEKNSASDLEPLALVFDTDSEGENEVCPNCHNVNSCDSDSDSEQVCNECSVKGVDEKIASIDNNIKNLEQLRDEVQNQTQAATQFICDSNVFEGQADVGQMYSGMSNGGSNSSSSSSSSSSDGFSVMNLTGAAMTDTTAMEQLQNLRNRQHHARSVLSENESLAKRLQAQEQEMLNDVKSLTSHQAELAQTLEKVNAKTDRKDKEMCAVKKKIAAKMKENSKAQGVLNDAESDLQKIEAEVAEQQRKNDKFAKTVQLQQSQQTAHLERMREESERHNVAMKGLTEENERELESRIRPLERQLEELKERLGNAEKQRGIIQEEHTAKMKRIQKMKDSPAAHSRLLRSLSK